VDAGGTGLNTWVDTGVIFLSRLIAEMPVVLGTTKRSTVLMFHACSVSRITYINDHKILSPQYKDVTINYSIQGKCVSSHYLIGHTGARLGNVGMLHSR